MSVSATEEGNTVRAADAARIKSKALAITSAMADLKGKLAGQRATQETRDCGAAASSLDNAIARLGDAHSNVTDMAIDLVATFYHRGR